METIPDDIDVISSTAKKLSDLVGPDGFVFSSGGIGPTHDDMTYDVRPGLRGTEAGQAAFRNCRRCLRWGKSGSNNSVSPLRLSAPCLPSLSHFFCWRLQGIAKAFGVKLAVHPPTVRPKHEVCWCRRQAAAPFSDCSRPHAVWRAQVEKMRVHYEKQGKELNAARMRMATLPEGAFTLKPPPPLFPASHLSFPQ